MMRPDIEWRIGEAADEETIFRVDSAAARWRAGAILFVVAAGLGLGLLYSSIPEPPRRPTAPPPPPVPVAALPERDNVRDAPYSALPVVDEYTRFNLLRDVIDREVNALADGDQAAFLALQDQTDRDWLDSQRQAFNTWDRPSPAAEFGALYFYGGIPPSAASDQGTWIDIRQYRRGTPFRETRFYRWQTNRWVRVQPALDFWDDAFTEIVTPRFRVHLPQADAALAADLVRRLENTYQQICFDLACPDTVLTPTQPLRVLISPHLTRQQAWLELGATDTLHLPSPRVTGLLETVAAIDPGDPLTQLLYPRLSAVIARAVSGGHARWGASSNGVYFMNAVALWELQRRQRGIDLDDYLGVDLLKGRKLTLPKYLWDWPVRDNRRLASPQAQTNSVVAYIDRSFGAERVAYFLKMLGMAQSLPQAIETTLPISYVAFEQQWQQWLEAKLSE